MPVLDSEGVIPAKIAQAIAEPGSIGHTVCHNVHRGSLGILAFFSYAFATRPVIGSRVKRGMTAFVCGIGLAPLFCRPREIGITTFAFARV